MNFTDAQDINQVLWVQRRLTPALPALDVVGSILKKGKIFQATDSGPNMLLVVANCFCNFDLRSYEWDIKESIMQDNY